MDESVRAAMAKWPDVPGLYGWISLDEAGHWRLKGEPITHAGLIEFINRNYECDEQGRWFFQNGPQRGYVDLAYTPWILHVDNAGQLRTHTGATVDSLQSAWVDDDGNLLLETPLGIGLVGTSSLATVAEWLVDASDQPLDADRVQALVTDLADGRAGELRLHAPGGESLPVGFIERAAVAQHFGFVATPRGEDN